MFSSIHFLKSAQQVSAGFSVLLCFMLSACTIFDRERDSALAASSKPAALASVSAVHSDLISLPPPKGKIIAAVYAFRDQTGQYKPSPDSSFSTAVTQGAASMLTKAMVDS